MDTMYWELYYPPILSTTFWKQFHINKASIARHGADALSLRVGKQLRVVLGAPKREICYDSMVPLRKLLRLPRPG